MTNEELAARVVSPGDTQTPRTAATDTDDLARIYIRSFVNGHWDSLSLRELLDGGQGGQIASWFYRRILGASGMEEGQIVTETNVRAMLELLAVLGIQLVRLRDGAE